MDGPDGVHKGSDRCLSADDESTLLEDAEVQMPHQCNNVVVTLAEAQETILADYPNIGTVHGGSKLSDAPTPIAERTGFDSVIVMPHKITAKDSVLKEELNDAPRDPRRLLETFSLDTELSIENEDVPDDRETLDSMIGDLDAERKRAVHEGDLHAVKMLDRMMDLLKRKFLSKQLGGFSSSRKHENVTDSTNQRPPSLDELSKMLSTMPRTVDAYLHKTELRAVTVTTDIGSA